MALKEKDKEWIRGVIREEFFAALFREVTLQKKARGPGEVDGKIETTTDNLLDVIARSLPYWEQAVNGAAEASEQSRNRSNEVLDRVQAMVDTFVSMENSVKVMARFAIALKETGLLEQMEQALSIEYKPDEANTR
jgi:hypothetical protein